MPASGRTSANLWAPLPHSSMYEVGSPPSHGAASFFVSPTRRMHSNPFLSMTHVTCGKMQAPFSQKRHAIIHLRYYGQRMLIRVIRGIQQHHPTQLMNDPCDHSAKKNTWRKRGYTKQGGHTKQGSHTKRILVLLHM